MSLHPSSDEKANADFLVADYDYKQWNSQGADTGSNRQSRASAEATLQAFYGANRGNPAAAKFALIAAYEVFKMKKTVGDGASRSPPRRRSRPGSNFRTHAAVKDGKNEALTPPLLRRGGRGRVRHRQRRYPRRVRHGDGSPQVHGRDRGGHRRLQEGRDRGAEVRSAARAHHVDLPVARVGPGGHRAAKGRSTTRCAPVSTTRSLPPSRCSPRSRRVS